MFLTIVIPVFNTKVEFLRECFTSLKYIDLLEDEFEVIVVDDGSSSEETKQFLKSLNSYRVIFKENGGPSSARNKGVSVAKGTYIYNLDADDKLSEDFNKFLNVLKKDSKIDVLYGDLSIFGTEEKLVKHPDFNRFILFFQENIIPSCSFFKKKLWERVKGYDESYKSIEDYDFWVRCALNNAEIVHLPYCAYHYRKIEDGVSFMQKTMGLYEEHLLKIKQRLPYDQSALFEFIEYSAVKNNDDTKSFLNSLFLKYFQKKKRKVIGLLLFLYFPKFYKLLNRLGMFSFKDKFI